MNFLLYLCQLRQLTSSVFFSVCCFLIFSCHFEYERPRLGGTKNACFTLWLWSAGLNNIIQGSGMLYERGPAFLSFIATCALMFSLRAAQEQNVSTLLWLPLMSRVGGRSFVRMSSQAMQRKSETPLRAMGILLRGGGSMLVYWTFLEHTALSFAPQCCQFILTRRSDQQIWNSPEAAHSVVSGGWSAKQQQLVDFNLIFTPLLGLQQSFSEFLSFTFISFNLTGLCGSRENIKDPWFNAPTSNQTIMQSCLRFI